MLLCFLGRSVEGILKDARDAFPQERRVLVVTRDNDTLPAPAGLETVEVSKFQPEQDEAYTVIANGGTSSQLLPVIKRLVEAGNPVQAFDLQRDGVKQVW